MNKKYTIISGITLLIIFLVGIGFYSFNKQNNETSTLGAESIVKNMSPDEFDQAIKSGEYKLIDVRTADEYNQGHLSNAFQIDFYQAQEFNKYLDSLDKNEKYLLYCRSGNRSGQALNIMKQKGFVNVSDLSGGISAWSAAGFPIEN